MNIRKKCAIITLYGLYNYGNRLQNYASQYVLEKLGYEVKTIVNTDLFSKEKYIDRIKSYLKYILQSDYRKIKANENKRRVNFLDFEKLVHEDIISNKEINALEDRYDFFVVGSDQVWNPYLKSIGWYFLDFCKNNKKITMAPSIGVNKLSDEYLSMYGKYLKQFKYLSCREQEGVNIIKQLTGKEVVDVLDPTMLVPIEEWEKIIEKCELIINDKYVLLYFLGKITDEYQEFINERKKDGYIVINILDKKSNYYTYGPREFLYLIKNATLVITDSFHACVFSILFNRDFIVFERMDDGDEMTSRIYTLLRKFKLEDRLFSNFNNKFEIDFANVEAILKTEQEKSISFLKKSFDNN